ncbi:hypothetical protein EV177_008801 [Coemansia sp. RSA 1804]|nr:hypothetical protein EV177_008801 [Coemansia sp. RSA 1804]
MSNWSISSLTTNSSSKSIISMPTPSPDQNAPSFSYDIVANNSTNGSSNEETLVESISLANASFPNVGSKQWEGETVNIYQPSSPTHGVRKRRRASVGVEEDIDEPQRKVFKLCNLSASKLHERRSPEKENHHHSNCSDISSHHTPEKLYESYRPSGSPTRVSGSRVATNVKFTDADKAEKCRVDKSLVCKGFWDEIGEAGRICLPRRSGKTYNLTQLLLFYSISPEEEYLHSVPDSVIATDDASLEEFQVMDLETRCRMKLFEISLTEMGSGANNIKDIRMGNILSTSHPHSGSGLDALTDSFWFNVNEIELMLDSSAQQCPRILAHKPVILKTVRDWYNGYYIGRFRGKYNPWSVSSFIESLCNLLNKTTSNKADDIKRIVNSAAKAYWVTTGSTSLIEAQIDRHRAQFIRLAKRLLRNYELTKVKRRDRRRSRLREPSHVSLVSTRLSLTSFDNDQFSEPGMLTLCLYAGYLTRHLSTSVCIPNHDVYQVWLQLFARAVLGTELADSSTNSERGALLSEFWQGRTDLLRTLATSSHGVLSNHKEYKEKDYANHVANTIMAVSRFGVLTHPKQKSVKVSHVIPIRENHAGVGRCDYTMRLYSTSNQPNQFGVIIEFKLIPDAKRDDVDFHRNLSEQALEQITTENYDSCLLGCLERMDIGMAIGNNAVYTVSRLYKRSNIDEP